MTAQVIAIKPESLNAMVTKTRAAWDRADQKKADADDWARRTGKYLVELKKKTKEEGRRWLDVLEQLGRSQQRANELMQLVGGEVTIEQQRERTRKAVQKTREKQKALLRNSGLRVVHDTPEDEYVPPTMEERVQISLENLCGDVLAREPYFDKNFPGWRSVKLPSHIKTLVREAATALTSLAAIVTAK